MARGAPHAGQLALENSAARPSAWRMKFIFGLAVLLLSAGSALGDVFTVAGREIHVPAPEGFVPVTEAMPQVKRLTDRMADPMNDTLAFYISTDIEPAARAGELPALGRYFILKVNKKLRDHTMGAAEFSSVKSAIKQQNQKIFEEIRSKIPGYMETIGQGVQKEFDVSFAMTISQMVPMEPHWEVADAMAYSMFINYGMTVEGQSSSSVVAATSTFMNPAGSLLFLYAYGDKDELEWTRSASATWANQIRELNAPPPAKSAGGAGFDWSRFGGKVVVGAVIGALVGLVGGLVFRKKKADVQPRR